MHVPIYGMHELLYVHNTFLSMDLFHLVTSVHGKSSSVHSYVQ